MAVPTLQSRPNLRELDTKEHNKLKKKAAARVAEAIQLYDSINVGCGFVAVNFAEQKYEQKATSNTPIRHLMSELGGPFLKRAVELDALTETDVVAAIHNGTKDDVEASTKGDIFIREALQDMRTAYGWPSGARIDCTRASTSTIRKEINRYYLEGYRMSPMLVNYLKATDEKYKECPLVWPPF